MILSVASSARASPSVRYFGLVSSVGASANATAGNFYLATKGKIERAVAGLGFDSVGIFRPSVLVAERDEWRCGEAVGICCVRYVYCCVSCCCRAYAAIDVDRVAQAMLADSLRMEPKGNRVFDGSGAVEDAIHTTASASSLLGAPATAPPRQQMQQQSEEEHKQT